MSIAEKLPSILIANRGEIACRIIRTAKRLGIHTVAVYSDADVEAQHRRLADEAVHIGPSPVRESYLAGERIIAAALATGAEAIHPGYGFLSENPDFVEAVERAGLVFIGPSASSIRAMGLKDAAKRLMEQAGVPVVPGYHGDNQDAAFLAGEAGRIGYPVLIKASAGGGGKGMRRVDQPQDFAAALESCRREAKSSFGDYRVLIEKYILSPRHIEVQVLADGRQAIHCYERECSLQRRRQKVWEEAPSRALSEELREELCGSAVALAKAVGYSGAGTVEYLYDDEANRFYFIEMNTRIQVEHPVTEAITGIDLVAEMLRIAGGEPLRIRQKDVSVRGHAIEVRINAEDPSKDFAPFPGTVGDLRLPGGPGVGFDSMLYPGYQVPPFYDSLLAKLIVHGETREAAITRLVRALGELKIDGMKTTKPLFLALAADPSVKAGDVHTRWLEGWLNDNAAKLAD